MAGLRWERLDNMSGWPGFLEFLAAQKYWMAGLIREGLIAHKDWMAGLRWESPYLQ